MTFKTTLSLSFTTILLASCSMIPTLQDPTQPVPARWTSDAVISEGQAIPEAWWSIFNDATLNALVDEAISKNLDIQAGLERVAQSRAALKIAGANLLPSSDATASIGQSRTNPSVGKTDTSTPVSGALSIAYDLDIFGKNEASRDAARATLAGQEFTQKALELAIGADVAESYFNLILTRERLGLGRDNLKNSRDLLNVIEARVKAGVDSNLELSQQKVAVANAEAALSRLEQSEAVYKNALAILLGKAPQDFANIGGDLDTVLVPMVSPGQPSTLLERRPDIRAVEQNLIAANANIGVARAAYFPSITLGLTARGDGVSLSDPIGTSLAAASTLTAPIFQGGRLEGGVELATAEQRELIANYRKAVLTAYGEVENSLSAVRTSGAQEQSLKTAVSEAKKAYDISRKRYQVGTIDFATMLNTQANLIQAEDTYAQAMKERLSDSLDLVKALGGGWKP
jgi:multidrug efflux system outer membrane protein